MWCWRHARAGGLGYLKAGLEALFGIKSSIQSPQKDPADYDLVVLGTPVWNMSLTPAIRSYITQHTNSFNRVAFFLH